MFCTLCSQTAFYRLSCKMCCTLLSLLLVQSVAIFWLQDLLTVFAQTFALYKLSCKMFCILYSQTAFYKLSCKMCYTLCAQITLWEQIELLDVLHLVCADQKACSTKQAAYFCLLLCWLWCCGALRALWWKSVYCLYTHRGSTKVAAVGAAKLCATTVSEMYQFGGFRTSSALLTRGII